MKIVHTASGKAYQLKPGTRLEVERTNLFFNNYGEQTLPLELPDTDLNRHLTGYPDMGVNKGKPLNNIQVTIQDGGYFMPCRQAVLGAQRKENIATAFYMNEGSFLSRIEELSLREMFGNEVIPGISTVAEGIAFCKQLLTNYDERYTCFPALVDFDGERKYINRVEWMDSTGNYILSAPASTPPSGYSMGLYNQYARIETSGSGSALLDPGYYITPFIRARYLLRRIFEYFGYTLTTNFFDTVQPFKDMVFVNNTMDSLVNGTILVAHLVPDCMCSTILDVFRKKFNCEFIADEVEKTVSVKFFNDIMGAKATVDLSGCLTKPLSYDYSEEWKRLKLSSQSSIDNADNSGSLSALILNHPELWFQPADGAYYHTGYAINESVEKIAGATLPYSAGGSLKEEEITVPDCAVSMSLEDEGTVNSVTDANYVTTTSYRYRARSYFPLLGDANALNSTVNSGVVATEGSPAAELTAQSHNQDPSLCFVYMDDQGFYTGTTTSYDRHGIKLWNYSLHYNGEYGIFEKFYRKMDDLYRNSLIRTDAELLLSDIQKQNISAHEKIVINGQELLINNLKYTIGGSDEPMASELLTTQLYEPVTHAPLESERLSISDYAWKLNTQPGEFLTQKQYDALTIKSNSLPYIYPAPPTESQYNSGGTYYERYSYVPVYEVGRGFLGYIKTKTWLTPVLKLSHPVIRI